MSNSANDELWQTKLHARLHDPAEKALVLLRDPAGHEGGTSRALHRLLGFDSIPESGRLTADGPMALDTILFKNGIPTSMYRTVKRADWWASAADRPQWPMEEIATNNGRTRKVADWAQVRWTKQPTLIHPLNGKKFDLISLADTDIHDIKERSRAHLERLIVRNDETVDWKRTLFAYWRFGPELGEGEDNGWLGQLWPLLPADTRVPDHSIWDHLDLTSAFAGAFAADPDGEAALLALSIGPVQSFIAAARSTSDLWAGSHLLARLSWEATKVVCKRFGPDAILFPRLRGVPQVDVWLRDECELPREWFDNRENCDWAKTKTDANRLFSAALPNRFVALVPASEAKEIVEAVEKHVRDWLRSLGGCVVDRLLEVAELRRKNDVRDESVHAYKQMCEQLHGFPEVHWAVVPFSLIRPRDAERQTDLDTTSLSETMAPFFGVASDVDSGFLASPAWKVLREDRQWDDNTTFFAPNPGVLYPAIYDLAERALAAAKAVRPFKQTRQTGWRCSLTGETEWLTADETQLHRSYRNQKETLWAKVAKAKPAWAKAGEHLGALPATKRLWPTLFAEEVAKIVGVEAGQISRFVVSTHTMALAKHIERFLGNPARKALAENDRAEIDSANPVALPRKLMRMVGGDPDVARWVKQLPGLLEAAAGQDDEQAQQRAMKLVKDALAVKGQIETYYALLLMDGDHMGRILSGAESATGDGPKCTISYLDSLHPQVQHGFKSHARENPAIKEYGDQQRAMSPNRHLAISAALNDFALHVVPEIVEGEFLGRVLYAGGDDVMAMLPVADLLPAMRRLRQAYSGEGDAANNASPDWKAARRSGKLVLGNGFALGRGRLMRMMGGATASCGAVIAHHQAPLAAVMRELREAEQRAKNNGRDSFSLSVIKRSGGAVQVTAKWGDPLDLLLKVGGFLAEPSVSRRAVYNSLVWLKDLPEDADANMLGKLLGYQFDRQSSPTDAGNWNVAELASRIAGLAVAHPRKGRHAWLEQYLGVAEFLAREARTGPASVAAGSSSDATPAAAHG